MAATGRTKRGADGRRAVWAGVSLLLAPCAHALELGELVPASGLGQPLAVTIGVRLGPGEALVEGCVRAQAAGGDLPAVPAATVLVPMLTGPGDALIRVSSGRPLFEPVYALDLRIACPGAPVMVRQYVLMLDLPGTAVPVTVPASTPRAIEAPPSILAPDPGPAPALAPARAATPLATGDAYVVQSGDTLSTIAARVADRDGGIWATAEAIFRANPTAFIAGDRDRLKAGATLQLPAGMTVATAEVAAAAPAAAPVGELEPAARGADPALPAAPVTTPVNEPVISSSVPVPGDAALAAPAVAARMPRVDPVGEPPAPRRPASSAPRADAGAAEPDPIVAVLAGLAFGLVVSGALWSRRVRDLLRAAPGAAPTPARTDTGATDSGVMPLPIGQRTRPEPAISVSFEPHDDDPLAREFARPPLRASATPPAARPPATSRDAGPEEEITSELEELFNVPPGTPRRDAYGDATAIEHPARAPAYPAPVDIGAANPDDVTAAVPARTTAETITVEQPRPATAGLLDDDRPDHTGNTATIDLHALAQGNDAAGPQARTLMEALSLLERDYEQELTASQVLDRDAVRMALGDEALENTARRRR